MFQKPPYTITEKAADLLAKIVEAATRLELGTDFKRDIRLHRENRVRTIHSSLAIEGNSLSLDEVTAVLQGKVVAGKQAEIKEVKNAYEAIEYAREKNDSGAFIEFTLSAILDTIALQVEHQVQHQVEHQVEITDTQHAILSSLENKSLSRKEIFAGIGMKGDSRSFKRIVEPLIDAGLVERTVPDKPRSSLQKYRLTDKGRALLAGSAL